MLVRHTRHMMSKPMILTIAVIVTLVSIEVIYVTLTRADCPGCLTTDLSAFQTAGEIAAIETLKLTSNHAKIVVLAYPNDTDTNQPATVSSAPLQTLVAAFQRQPSVQTVVVERIGIHEQQLRGPDKGLSVARYLTLLNKHADADAIVSFVGVPVPLPDEWSLLPARRPKFVAVFTSEQVPTTARLRRLFAEEVIHVAISPRPVPQPTAVVPKTARQRFEQLFGIVTAANAAVLPEVYAH